jgi:adenine-specific DNA methylase
MPDSPISRLPARSLLEDGLPVEQLYQLAKREGNAKKPIYEIHKWWARRLGHIFRVLLIAATTPSDPTPEAQTRLMEAFYEKNDLAGLTVLDPFMGGGTSVVESLKCGASVIGVDVDPVAWFVTKKEIEPFDLPAFEAAFKKVETALQSKLRGFYQTRNPNTGESCEIVNVFWVTLAKCPECSHTNAAHPHYRLSIDLKNDVQVVFCKHCGEVRSLPTKQTWYKCHHCSLTTSIAKGTARVGAVTCEKCGTRKSLLDLIEKGTPARKEMFAIEFSHTREPGKPGRQYKKADLQDIRLYEEVSKVFAQRKAEIAYPTDLIFEDNRFDARPVSHGFSRYDQLFNPRQLYSLSLLLSEILKLDDKASKEYLLLAFSDCLASNNQLVSYAFGYQKITPLFAIHGYQIPQRPVEGNVWGNDHLGRGSFIRCVRKVVAGKKYAAKPFEYRYPEGLSLEKVYTGESIMTAVRTTTEKSGTSSLSRACLLNRSSIDLSGLASGSVDLVLTDPPFYNNLAYSELSDFYYQWLRLYFVDEASMYNGATAPIDKSFLVRRKTSAEHSKYVNGLSAAMKECSRVLKKDGMLVFTFHHREAAAWYALALSLQESSFRVTSVCPVRAEGVSGFHSYGGTPKWDAVICCRPRTTALEDCEWRLDSSIEAVVKYEREWTERLEKAELPWNDADKASFSYSLVLREIVNQHLAESRARVLFDKITANCHQKGVSGTIPHRAASA